MVGHDEDGEPQYPESESQLQAWIVVYARRLGLKVAHWWNGRPVEDGFPDLVISGDGGTVFWELKGDGGTLSRVQAEWAARLRRGGNDYAIMTPQQWASGVIQRWLHLLAKPQSKAA
jgi:hypothetical protein